MKILLPVYDLTKNILDVVLRGASFKKKKQANDNQGNRKYCSFYIFRE